MSDLQGMLNNAAGIPTMPTVTVTAPRVTNLPFNAANAKPPVDIPNATPGQGTFVPVSKMPLPEPPVPDLESAYEQGLKTQLNDVEKRLSDISQSMVGATEKEQENVKSAQDEAIKERQGFLGQLAALKYNMPEVPKPPEMKKTQDSLRSIFPALIGLLGILAHANGGKGDFSPAFKFSNMYKGMLDSFRAGDIENFMIEGKKFQDELETYRIQNQAELEKYHDELQKIILGKADVNDWLKIQESQAKFPVQLLMAQYQALSDMRTRLNTALKNADSDAWKKWQAENALYKDEIAKTRLVQQQSQMPRQFDQWSPEEKTMWYQLYERGIPPRFAWGDRVSYSQFTQGFAQWEANKSSTGGKVAATIYGTKARGRSLDNLEKSYGMAMSFVENLNTQISRLEKIFPEIVKRVGVRALDLPRRKLLMAVKGSGNEQVITMYLLDISNEVAKLSTGSQASVRELSTEAQERWSKIHDPNLSLNELKKILTETESIGNIKLNSLKDSIDKMQERIATGDQAATSDNLGTSKGTKASEPKAYDALPDPAQFKGGRAKDMKTGQWFTSNGKEWVPIGGSK